MEIGNDEYTGMLTTEKSVTIPGQDMTPTELITRFTSAPRPEHIFPYNKQAINYSQINNFNPQYFLPLQFDTSHTLCLS